MATPRTVLMAFASPSAHIGPPNSPRPSESINHSQLTLYMADGPEAPEVPPTPTSVSFKHDSHPPPSPATPVSQLSAKPILKKEKEKEMEKEKEKEKAAVQQDPWDYDAANPRNWSLRTKWAMTSIVSLYTFVAYVLRLAAPRSPPRSPPFQPSRQLHDGTRSSRYCSPLPYRQPYHCRSYSQHLSPRLRRRTPHPRPSLRDLRPGLGAPPIEPVLPRLHSRLRLCSQHWVPYCISFPWCVVCRHSYYRRD